MTPVLVAREVQAQRDPAPGTPVQVPDMRRRPSTRGVPETREVRFPVEPEHPLGLGDLLVVEDRRDRPAPSPSAEAIIAMESPCRRRAGLRRRGVYGRSRRARRLRRGDLLLDPVDAGRRAHGTRRRARARRAPVLRHRPPARILPSRRPPVNRATECRAHPRTGPGGFRRRSKGGAPHIGTSTRLSTASTRASRRMRK